MDVTTQNYVGKERRSNGKLKLSYSDWLKVIGIVSSAILCSILWVNRTNSSITILQTDIIKTAEALNRNEDGDKQQNDNIIELQVDVKNINKNVTTIMEDIKLLLRRNNIQ